MKIQSRRILYSMFIFVMVFVSVVLTGCASFNSDSGSRDANEYIESQIDQKNLAPLALRPTPNLNGDSIDPVYLRTQADYYFSMGEAYSLEGNSQKAIESFKMTLVYDPPSSEVNMRLAAEYIKMGMVTEALSQANEAVKKNPQEENYRLLLGGLYSSLRVYDKALIQYQHILKINPKSTEAPLYIGAIYSEQKQYQQAISYFEGLLKNAAYGTPHLVYYYMARVHVEEGHPKSYLLAESEFQKALQLKPDFTDAAIALGAYYKKTKQLDKAIGVYKKYQMENSPQPRIIELLAQSYLEKEDYDSAYEQLEILENYSEDVLNVKMKMALILIEKKLYPVATQKLEEILREVPESDKIRFYLAAVYEEMKMFDEAAMHFKAIPPSSSFYVESITHAAYIYKNKEQLKDAIQISEEALKHKKDQPQLCALYAAFLDEAGEYQKALSFLKEARERFPDNAQIEFYYGAISDHVGNKKELIAAMRKVIQIDPRHVQGMNYLAYTLSEEGNSHLDEAEIWARKALVLDPKDGYVMDTLGWILYKKGKNHEAIKFLELAFKTQSRVSVIAEHLGDAYIKHSMVEKAKVMYKKAAELETDTKKVQEILSKLTALDKQQIDVVRLPASK